MDIRLISATNADIDLLIENGGFRRDLYYRLNTVILRVPALRERPEDIQPLAQHFLDDLSARYRKQEMSLSDEAILCLHAHDWPGNVRELSHAIERAILVCPDSSIRPVHLGIETGSKGVTQTIAGDSDLMTLEEMEKRLIEKTLEKYRFNISQCAVSLGISRSSMYRKMDALGLSDSPVK